MPEGASPSTVLKLGVRGPEVLGWQRFLVKQKLLTGKVDFVFGSGTEAATIRFQKKQGLSADGKVGKGTVKAAAALGYDPARDGFWPPIPDFPALGSNKQRAALFGTFAFVPSPSSQDPDAIRITDGWDKQNIVPVDVPQLKGVPGARKGRVQFHRKAAAQLQAMFADWEKAGLKDRLLSFDGSYVPRFQRNTTTALSSHSWGSSFDLNQPSNSFLNPPAGLGMKGCLLELVEIANRHGFFWGGHFSSRIDGMHFEVAKLKG